MRLIRNLALVGFMGTGKSSVGRLAAEVLQFDFIDTDDWIEGQTGKSIAEIFAHQGEAAFRAVEEQAVIQLGQRANTVIATGGGMVANPANLASLKEHALVVCLWASPETIWERLRSQTHRPLLQTADPLAKIRELLAERDSAYRQSDVLIHTGLRPPKEVVQQVVYQFHLARKSSR
ncbi:MAG TPA: shikimate kinase [Candidatus Saccharimonadales bacterium]|nr:shikimate kinase [Candidatus Saccharimonadales bacterium]